MNSIFTLPTPTRGTKGRNGVSANNCTGRQEMNEIYETTVECASEIERVCDHEDWDFWEAMTDFCKIRELIAAQRKDRETDQ
jgi:hypothetical protein